MKSIYSFDRWFVGLMFMAALLLFVRLGSAPIYILDEAKNAQCAREMWDRGDWVVPTFNGELRTDKPALHYWFMRIAYSVAGVGAAQARFFSAVLGVLLVAITYFKVQKLESKGVAFFSSAALVFSPHYIFEFRLSVPDPYLIFFTTLGLYFGYNYIEHAKRLSLLGASVALGLATLAKGPVALALPGLILLIFVLYKKNWKVFKDPFLILAILLAMVVTLPWYYSVHQATEGAFTKGFFLNHNLNRFAGEKEGHGGPFIMTPLMVILGMLPASLAAAVSLSRKNSYRQHPLFVFSWIAIAVYIAFFSISSTKLPNYAMPCYPFVAIVAGYFMNDVFSGVKKWPVTIWVVWLVLGIAIPVGGYFALQNEEAVHHLAWVALCLFLLPLAILYGWFKKQQVLQSFGLIGLGWFLFTGIIVWVGYPLIYQQNPVAKLKPLLRDKKMLFAYKSYNAAFNFNLTGNDYLIPVAQSTDSLKSMVQKSGEGGGGAPVYVITRLEFLPELQNTGFAEVGRHRDLFELPTTVILKLNP